ncbi:MAG TPA: hypothetical protein VES79_10300 [Solirubrobacteraceae bacterium]|nr:hypothetical protein [Solirubrobacteraceae bacterium]
MKPRAARASATAGDTPSSAKEGDDSGYPERQRGRHFDPQLVDAFLRLVPTLEPELIASSEAPPMGTLTFAREPADAAARRVPAGAPGRRE